MKRYIVVATALLGIGCANGSTNSSTIELEGKLSMKRGAMTHSRDSVLVIKDRSSNKNYMIQNPKKFDLESRQNHTLKLKATLLEKAKGPGRFAIIEVLEVKN